MKKAFTLVFVLTAAVASAQVPYELGQRLSDASFVDIPKQRCLTAPGIVEPCLRVRTQGVIYTIGFRPKGRIITYLETHDASFATADGLRVGSSLNAEPGTLAWAEAYGEVVGPDTGDGWQPIVARDRSVRCENHKLTELGAGNSVNSEGCRIRILGFKKRSVLQRTGKEWLAATRRHP